MTLNFTHYLITALALIANANHLITAVPISTAVVSEPSHLKLKLPSKSEYSAVGDPGMKRDGLRVAFEGWNFCNEVGVEAPGMGSPRAADCFDLVQTGTSFFLLRIANVFKTGPTSLTSD